MQISAKLNHRFLSHCRRVVAGCVQTRAEENRLEPNALFIGFFEHFKNKIKICSYSVFFYLLQIMVKV
jgi:hypothetical protein